MAAGAAMGAIGGLATRLCLGANGRPLGRAGWLAAGMWEPVTDVISGAIRDNARESGPAAGRRPRGRPRSRPCPRGRPTGYQR